jgi:hypothetical protein
MRTTVSIDDDVLAAARERAAREGRTLGEVLSALARLGLTARSAASSDRETHGFRPLPPRGGPVTNALIDRLREDEDG